MKVFVGNKAVEIQARNCFGRVIDVEPSPILANNSWAVISYISRAGRAADYWNIGDEKTVELSNGETLTLQIYDFNHDDRSDGKGKAGITFGSKNVLATTYQMKETDTNVGSWKESKFRVSDVPDIWALLPSDLAANILEVTKTTTAGKKSTSIVSTADKIFIPSWVEVGGSGGEGYDGEGSLYPIFSDNNSRIKKDADNVARNWWLRSPHLNAVSGFRVVNSGGIISQWLQSTTAQYVSICVCV